jgi:PAS domain S-box-containing protein
MKKVAGTPAGLRPLLHSLGQEVSRQPLPDDVRAEVAATLGRLEALLAGAPANGTGRHHLEARALRLEGMFTTAAEGLFVTDANGIILEANPAAAELLGARREFLPGKPLPLFIHGARQAGFYTLLVRLRREGGGVRDWRAVLKPISGRPVEVMLSVLAAPGLYGEGFTFRWVMRDVTAAAEVERALRSERDFATKLLDTAQALVLVLDEDGRIARANPFLCQVTGHDEANLLGQPWATLLPPEEQLKAHGMVMQALARGGEARRSTGGLLTRDGRRRFVSWAAKALPPTRWDEGSPHRPPTAVLVVGHDITELQEAQRKTLQAERLAALGQAMASIAHESRNLLQRARSGLERLGWRLENRPEELELVQRVGVALNDLTQLLDDVRTYGGAFQLKIGPCDVREVWRQAWEQVRAVHPTKEAALVETVETADCHCAGDCFRLGQVFRNVLENAFAACADAVRVEVRCTDAECAGRPAVCVAVRDNGPGLSAEARQRLFEPFYTTRPGGSGLGMVIARRVVDAHGGSIEVGDAGPPGAEILVTLPRGQ